MTGASLYEIWNQISCALGNEYHALWWERENRIRQMNSLAKLPEILILPLNDETESADLIV